MPEWPLVCQANYGKHTYMMALAGADWRGYGVGEMVWNVAAQRRARLCCKQAQNLLCVSVVYSAQVLDIERKRYAVFALLIKLRIIPKLAIVASVALDSL